ncbi:bifunctional demethylmenaquinone methyltransferase/2-methoxy-6-polyprenyl-1,4-benzoquinol methylase [Leptolyngbya sp. 'hensonii']|uniref:bifunctional demethylmenaquinone methyltransferase/2-methoxy-6-polyprenyl-1,4-benzoquinol methylase UbiE n=1 Tax=Leptolyngbya sp. 'hensonii' TaxID=1922337 RepID=UPI00094FFF74|nr:bifunctional demethylmenaquinone methyltransferase/2-methoxy-6-polyprenyl-1,4-benzoquinol methylase UbiE [Leptolyngbya sp. 'hensonii']OLP16172.1 bifunctional demethylmenaquinone methyltransferase/2-methoxy-6-polyprenyl-1,4-benzoquinol methylase [Leptolyngbya sp. 'hensonii']
MQSTDIQALFNRIAPVYNPLNDWLSLGQHRVWKQMTVKWSRAKQRDVCLDLCCGSGDLARLLARQVTPAGQVFGVDFASAQLDIARQQAAQDWPSPTITWIEADVQHLPFPDHHFDAATMGYGLRNVTDRLQSLQELHRVLKPGATAAILDFHQPTQPLMQAFQRWYLATIVVPTAERFGLAAEYQYIGPSLDAFLSGPEQVKLAHKAGFAEATHYPIAGGTMGVLVLTKGN